MSTQLSKHWESAVCKVGDIWRHCSLFKVAGCPCHSQCCCQVAGAVSTAEKWGKSGRN
jgi:hypothetical protein